MRGLTLGDPALLGAASGFSPLSLSPALWLDASDAATITSSGGLVSSWADKSGNGRNLVQAVSTAQPTTGTRTLNGRNVLDFDGTSDFMSGGNILEVGTGGVTMFGVAKLDTATGLRGMWGDSRANDQGGRFSMLFSATDGYFYALWADTASGAQPAATNDPGAANRTNTYAWGTRVIRQTSNTLWRNGSIVATNTSLSSTTNYSTANNHFLVGAYQNSTGNGVLANSYLDGYIGEVIVYLSSLSDADMGRVFNYLNAKWAVY